MELAATAVMVVPVAMEVGCSAPAARAEWAAEAVPGAVVGTVRTARPPLPPEVVAVTAETAGLVLLAARAGPAGIRVSDVSCSCSTPTGSKARVVLVATAATPEHLVMVAPAVTGMQTSPQVDAAAMAAIPDPREPEALEVRLGQDPVRAQAAPLEPEARQ